MIQRSHVAKIQDGISLVTLLILIREPLGYPKQLIKTHLNRQYKVPLHIYLFDMYKIMIILEDINRIPIE